MFVLPFMLGVYVLFLITIAVAYYAGGWVIVLVDKYQEGFFEIVLLTSILPLASYVSIKEAAIAFHEIRRKHKQ